MKLKNPIKTILYSLIFVLLIVAFVDQFFENTTELETSLLGSYGYDSSQIRELLNA